jgi:uncharacterized damage-inducible protein DinB
MNTDNLNNLVTLFERCQDLRDRLAEARREVSDEEWNAFFEGPFSEILLSVMDVEDALEECEDS